MKQIETKFDEIPTIPTKPRAARTTTARGTQPDISSIFEWLVPAKDHEGSWCAYSSTQSNKILLQKRFHRFGTANHPTDTTFCNQSLLGCPLESDCATVLCKALQITLLRRQRKECKGSHSRIFNYF